MSNLNVQSQAHVAPISTVAAPKAEKSVINHNSPFVGMITDKVEMSAKSLGKVASVSLLGGGAVTGLGVLALKSANSATGIASLGKGMLGLGLLSSAFVGVSGGIGFAAGTALGNSKGSGMLIGAAASSLLVSGMTFALTKDLKMSLFAAAGSFAIGGITGSIGETVVTLK